jgi:elongation factor P
VSLLLQGESIQLAEVEKLTLQYTYDDGENFNFMDTTSFEEVQLSRAVLGDKSNWLLEGATIEALKWTVRSLYYN